MTATKNPSPAATGARFATFRSSAAASEYADRTGARVRVLGDLADFGTPYDREDVGPMFRVRTPDGDAWDVFADELTDWSETE